MYQDFIVFLREWIEKMTLRGLGHLRRADCSKALTEFQPMGSSEFLGVPRSSSEFLGFLGFLGVPRSSSEFLGFLGRTGRCVIPSEVEESPADSAAIVSLRGIPRLRSG
jgi:hypothetical protein